MFRDNGIFEYASKTATRVDGPIEFGIKPAIKPIRDWDAIKEAAKEARFDDIPSDVFIRNFNSIRQIAA